MSVKITRSKIKSKYKVGQTVKAPHSAGERFGITDWIITDIFKMISEDGTEQIHISTKQKDALQRMGSYSKSEAYLDKYNGGTK